MTDQGLFRRLASAMSRRPLVAGLMLLTIAALAAIGVWPRGERGEESEAASAEESRASAADAALIDAATQRQIGLIVEPAQVTALR